MTPGILTIFLPHFQTWWEGNPGPFMSYYYTVLQVGASITPQAEEKASHTPNPLSSLKSLCLPPTMCLWERASYRVWFCH